MTMATAGKSGIATNSEWAHATSAALEKLYTYTLARSPSRTLIDPLQAFVDAFLSNPSVLSYSHDTVAG